MTKLFTNCEGVTRRRSLQLGLGGIVSGGLAGALNARASAAGAPGSGTNKTTADACILVWLDGGPSHYETFDPKPDAPVEIRGSYAPIETQTPGMRVSQHMKQLAAIS